MNEFNQRFNGLSEDQKQARYLGLAEACLAHYPTIAGEPTFIAHNSGIVYLVKTPHDKYLLKIAEAIGDGESDANPAYMTASLSWLDALAKETNLIIQQPVANQLGEFVTAVSYDDLTHVFYCTVQHWLDGQHTRNLSPDHMQQIGQMVAQLHNHSSQWIKDKTLPAWTYDGVWTNENLTRFSKVKSLNILSDAEWKTIEKAVDHIQQMIQKLGMDNSVWGPVHGDLHPQNLLVLDDGKLCPIDFDSLILAYYPYDLGVILYHTMYLGAANRQALVQGYRAFRDLRLISDMGLETFLCMAALANLSFQIELPEQRVSDRFIRNVREFATSYCDKLIHDMPFALEHYIRV